MSHQPNPDTRRPIQPLPPRWQPRADPSNIIIPGLDNSASVTDQIEQIEQLITIKLQNIDENFSKIHNLLANKLLPAVKRYAVGTEPVREAAQFWTSFYEQAAQIRIPTYEDYSSVNEPFFNDESEGSQPQQSHQDHEDDSTRPTISHAAEDSTTHSDSSFMPSQALFASTPATTHRDRIANPHHSVESQADGPSSIESPLVRLDRELQNFSVNDDGFTPVHPLKAPSFHHHPSDVLLDDSRDTSYLTSPEKGKGREASSLLRNVLQRELHTQGDSSKHAVSPLKVKKVKTPVPKTLNPYLPPDIRPSQWDGLVDLTDPRIATPSRGRYGGNYPATPDRPADEDSFEGLPPGMSPPVMMSPARPPRSMAELGLSKTPKSEAAARITRDLVSGFQRQGEYSSRREYSYAYSANQSAMESSVSTLQSIPSLSRYAPHDTDTSSSLAGESSIESMMRRMGMDYAPTSADLTAPDTPTFEPQHHDQDPLTPDSAVFFAQNDQYVEEVELLHDDPDSDSDSDLDDEINNTAHPSAAFLMASQGRPGSADDSFNSDHSEDSFGDDVEGLQPVNPFAGPIDNGFDDSFDDDSFLQQGVGGETETVFGVPPMQREQMAAARASGQFRVMGEELLEDTVGFTAHGTGPGLANDSPTPANWPPGNR
ncbi:hypothetical protein HGRIS_008581 [Hohenbuehelia grisea]|uniref:DASH complex subunit ASK1 n=1 Tax=Hohenbuehelia grisea TaxID=104357 RepID=A0ABR3J8N3_9AGAR